MEPSIFVLLSLRIIKFIWARNSGKSTEKSVSIESGSKQIVTRFMGKFIGNYIDNPV